MSEEVRFKSGDIELCGELFRAEIASQGGDAGLSPAVSICHGFAGAIYSELAESLAGRGITALTFSFRGYGPSDGEPGNVIAGEQVQDLRASMDYLSTVAGVDASNLAVIGSSLGGSIAILEAARDDRVKAIVAACPVARGSNMMARREAAGDDPEEVKLRVRHAEATNDRVHRFDIVYIPEHLRGSLPANTPMEFTPETFHSINDLDVTAVITEIPPRPLLLLHAKDDEVVPQTESDLLAEIMMGSCDYERLAEGNHFILALPSASQLVVEWIEAKVKAAGAPVADHLSQD